MVGVGLATDKVRNMATCAIVPLAGITGRIAWRTRELTKSLPGHRGHIEERARLVPDIW
jgi:hypothetical protein